MKVCHNSGRASKNFPTKKPVLRNVGNRTRYPLAITVCAFLKLTPAVKTSLPGSKNPLAIAKDRAGKPLDAVGNFFWSDKKTAAGSNLLRFISIQVIGARAGSMILHAFGAASSALGFRLFLDRRNAFFAILQET